MKFYGAEDGKDGGGPDRGSEQSLVMMEHPRLSAFIKSFLREAKCLKFNSLWKSGITPASGVFTDGIIS